LLLLAAPLLAQSVIPNNPGVKATVVIRNATIYPVTAPPIANGTIVLADGKIAAIGTSVSVPANAKVIDGTGLSVYPGLIDSGTTIGLTEIGSVAGTNDVNELGDLNPNARVEVALNPHSNVIPVTRINGITTVITRPGGGMIAGHDALIQLAGWTPREMVLKAPVGLHVNFPRVRAGSSFFEQPQDEEAEKERKKQYTRQLDKLRDTFRDAQAYAKALEAKQQRFDRDLILENLVDVVKGNVPVVVHADSAADIREAIKFTKALSLKMILAGGDDVQEVLKELKDNDIPVLLGPIWSLPPREDDPYDLLFANAQALHQAGIRFAIQTEEAHDARNLPYQAANCAAFGLPREEALKAITIYPAQIFGVADKIGSLEVGKIANVIVTDGDPLEIRTTVKQVFIGGEEISMESNQTLLYKKFSARP
jgi:imidazolonepropionase-like amidohydrolase